MKIYETRKEIKEITHTELVQRKCDLCGFASNYGSVEEWKGGDYRINETIIQITVRYRDGVNYPECGDGSLYDIDICPKCFKEKLIPWLESQGADIKQEKWGW